MLHPLAAALADSIVFRAAVVGETHGPPLEIARRLLDASPWFLVAALLAAFAQAFSEGQRLANDNEGLV